MYVSYAVFTEGSSDKDYLYVIIPRIIEHIVLAEGSRPIDVAPAPAVEFELRGTVEEVAKAACEARESFHLFFVHADTGGRALEAGMAPRSEGYCQAMHRECEWPRERCVVVAPRHETEAWIMMDPGAIAQALGYRGDLFRLGIPRTPAQCEALTDPKGTLNDVIRAVRGPRARRANPADLFPAIAAGQSFVNLRASASFQNFEDQVRLGLTSLGCLPRNQ